MILKSQRGQALVEFVILLPVFIFMLFIMIDFGKILYMQNQLESKMDDVATLYQNVHSSKKVQEQLNLEKEDIFFEVTQEDENAILSLKKEISIITPGLNLVLKNPFEASVKRVILNE